jgi:hypothetical protein
MVLLLSKIEKSLLIITVVLSMCLTLIGNRVVFADYTLGVKNGDWIKYDATFSYAGQGLSGSVKITVENVQGLQMNGTIEFNVQGYSVAQSQPISVDVSAGTGAYSQFIIPANLTIGDYIPAEGAYVQAIVTKAGRKAIVANASIPLEGVLGQLYWDQATGVLLEADTQISGTEYSLTLAGTNLWGGGFTFDWWAWMIIIAAVVIAALAALILLRKKYPRRKSPLQTESVPSVPPPPPPP